MLCWPLVSGTLLIHVVEYDSVANRSFRYSKLNIFGPRPKQHRGEPLFFASRKLLKDEFDQPSIAMIQAYVLLSTYHFCFGGSRKGLFYFCMLTIAASSLESADSSCIQHVLALRPNY